MKYQLVFQMDSDIEDGFDQLIKLEDKLRDELDSSVVDGHDFGNGEMNVFVLTDDPIKAFEEAKGDVDEIFGLSKVKAAFRLISSDVYIAIWPSDLTEFNVS